MPKIRLLSTSALRSALFLGFALSAAPALAQDQVTDEDDAATLQGEVEIESGDNATTDQELVVTGTRIRSPNLTSAVPITSVGIQDLTDTGDVSLGDALNELPSMRSTFSQSNSTAFIGTSGLNLLDLRGLGTARTLVLVNGRRHVTSQPGVPTSVDVNSIPVDLVERVDVVTGGNSAIYGSDAVAGVVNFILKRDFEGVRVRGQGGISDEGDRGSYTTSVTWGSNFGDGIGNIALSGEYAFSNDLYYTDRDNLYGAFSGRNQFQLSDNTLGEPAAGDGITDFIFRRGIRNIGISEGGAYGSTCPAAVAPSNANFAAVQARRALNCTGLFSPALPGQTGAEIGRVFVFDANGNLVANNPDLDFRPFGSGNGQGGLGTSLRLTGQLAPQLERYAFNLLTSVEVDDAFKPFLEAKYVRVNANQEGQPTSIANLQGTYRLDNPFLTPQARQLLQTSLAPGATTFGIQRFNVDFGGRAEEHKREVYRLVVGAEGTFNDDWRYEVAFNYGKLETFYRALGRVNLARFRNAADARLNAAGQIVCAINADAPTANDDPNCVPINVFGFGAPSQAALNYVVADVFRNQEAELLVGSAFVSGDLSQIFELPGGPIGFALGVEARTETAYSAFNPATIAGETDLNSIPVFNPPDLNVKEAFGEIRIPIFAEVPFAQELTIEAAGRVSDYNLGTTGTVWTYNVGGIYSPIRDIRFRAAYAKSVRAPTQSNLFAAPSQTFLNGLVDPCSQANINNGTQQRVANCAAAGVPVSEVVNGQTVPFTNVPASGIRGLSGSNPNLNEERGTSLTIGFVAQPRFVPGLSLSVDYYDITVDNVIFTLGAQTVIDQCYDSPSGIDNQYCAAVFRRPDGTFQAQSNRIVGGTTIDYTSLITPESRSFIQGPFNFAKQKTKGIDLDVAYRRNIFGDIGLDMRGIVSWLLERNNFTDINQPDFRDRAKSELGDPEWAASFSAKLDFGNWDFGYNLRYVGKQTIDFYETQNEFDGRPPTDLDKYDRVWYPDVFYHNFRIGFEPAEQFRFYAGVDNAFDRAPPFGLDGTGAGQVAGTTSAIFDNVGRFFYAGAELRF